MGGETITAAAPARSAALARSIATHVDPAVIPTEICNRLPARSRQVAITRSRSASESRSASPITPRISAPWHPASTASSTSESRLDISSDSSGKNGVAITQ
jgi:hypothetical protein